MDDSGIRIRAIELTKDILDSTGITMYEVADFLAIAAEVAAFISSGKLPEPKVEQDDEE